VAAVAVTVAVIRAAGREIDDVRDCMALGWPRVQELLGVTFRSVADGGDLFSAAAPGRPRLAGLQLLECAVEVMGGQQDSAVGALGHHLGDGAALVVGDPTVGRMISWVPPIEEGGNTGLVFGPVFPH
jgi:hypothetical protein